jgi:hypothetical protein
MALSQKLIKSRYNLFGKMALDVWWRMMLMALDAWCHQCRKVIYFSWFHSFMVSWFNGFFMVSWFHGFFMVSWFHQRSCGPFLLVIMTTQIITLVNCNCILFGAVGTMETSSMMTNWFGEPLLSEFSFGD